MIDRIQIRDSEINDRDAIEALYRHAFPAEDLVPLVKDLLQAAPITRSLAAFVDASLAGHVIFTTCGVAGSDMAVALLGPLAVAPDWQRKGVGDALVRHGLREMEAAGVSQVFVMGDPAYYGRFGFALETTVAPPYPVPEEWRGAWQSMSLTGAGPRRRGTLTVPRPWRRPSLWAP